MLAKRAESGALRMLALVMSSILHIAVVDDEADIRQLLANYLQGQGFRVTALTSGEFDLLHALAEHPGRVLSRDFLVEQTRCREAGPSDRAIDVQVGRLRRNLRDDAERPRMIRSVGSAGYVWVPPVTSD